jgi:hypothetical protein
MHGNQQEVISLDCALENSNAQLKKYPGKSLALVSCVQSVCPYWDEGRCGYLVRVGRYGRL